MIKRIFTVLAGLAISAPVNATSWTDVNTLTDLVKQTGTTVEARACQREGMQGFYQYDQEAGIDLLVVCSNVVDMSDSDAVWEVVSHEATHVMQACIGGPVLKDTYIPRVLRELQETAPHYYQTLQQYRGDHKRYELEAFWMELRAPNVVHEFLDRSCFAQPE